MEAVDDERACGSRSVSDMKEGGREHRAITDR